MEEFIARANIRNFQAQLAGCRDEAQKATLLKLLRDEERHLKTIMTRRAAGSERARS